MYRHVTKVCRISFGEFMIVEYPVSTIQYHNIIITIAEWFFNTNPTPSCKTKKQFHIFSILWYLCVCLYVCVGGGHLINNYGIIVYNIYLSRTHSSGLTIFIVNLSLSTGDEYNLLI